jgi:hypothetical protein
LAFDVRLSATDSRWAPAFAGATDIKVEFGALLSGGEREQQQA